MAKKLVEFKIDGVSFNARHFAQKSQADFVKECKAAATHPVELEGKEVDEWLKVAHAGCIAEVAKADKPADKPAETK